MVKDGGPAFPKAFRVEDDGIFRYDDKPGMTLRQWYAGMAMQSLIPIVMSPKNGLDDANLISVAAFKFADAMIATEAK